MDLKSLLNQALNSDFLNQASQKTSQATASIGQSLGDKKTLGALGAGAVGGGIIGVLMGSKKGKKIGKKALGIGSVAALGALAFKLYNDYGKQAATSNTLPEFNSQTSSDQQAMIIIKAMIAAAKADGHIDQQEMAKISEALEQLDADPQVQQLIQIETAKPLDPTEIAKLATSPEQATEIYLASLLVIDEQNFMEQAYLQELAKQLNLNPELVAQLHQQIQL